MLMRATGHADDQRAADLDEPRPDDPIVGSMGDSVRICHGILLGTNDHEPRVLPWDADGAGCTGFRIAIRPVLLQWPRRDGPLPRTTK